MKPLVFAPLVLLLACSDDHLAAVDGGAVDWGAPDGGAVDADASAVEVVWPTDATKLVATARGGFHLQAPTGSECTIADATYTFSVAARTLQWRYCHAGAPGAPYRWETGATTLSGSPFDALVAALKAVQVSAKRTCGADKEELTLTVTTASGENIYIDSFYGCDASSRGRTPVDNIDSVFALLRDPDGPTADGGQ